MRRPGALVMVCLVVPVGLATAARGEEVQLRSAMTTITLSTTGGLPVEWLACTPRCEDAGAKRMQVLRSAADGGEFLWEGGDPVAVQALQTLEYDAQIEEMGNRITAVLRSREPVAGRQLVQRYELSRTTHSLRVQLQFPAGVGVSILPASDFLPQPLPGLGGAFSAVDAVRLNEESRRPGITQQSPGEDRGGGWVGVRSQYWAWLARAPAGTARVDAPVRGLPRVLWSGESPGMLALEFYAGPVQWQGLRAVEPELSRLLYAGLWAPLRWLSFGLFFLLGFIARWVPNAGAAIILLSLCVKIILWPLTRIADRWQAEVNAIQSRLQPKLQAIKDAHRGEDAHRRTLQVYRDEGVSPWFTLKSLGGFAIQVPMFIAAFDMLAGNFALYGASFLWVRDLARPDAFAGLPWTVPFFGSDLNLLPVIMTALTVLASVLQRDASLTAGLQARQRRQLYLMAVAFFLLFYTFPAGMVLYWTANNFWHLVKVQTGFWYSLRRRRA